MGKGTPFFLHFLKEEFDQRMKKNSHYSLRSFARWIEIDPSFLSKVFSRQKVLSLDTADRIIVKLAPNNRPLRDKFIKSVSQELACYSLNKFDNDLTDCDD